MSKVVSSLFLTVNIEKNKPIVQCFIASHRFEKTKPWVVCRLIFLRYRYFSKEIFVLISFLRRRCCKKIRLQTAWALSLSFKQFINEYSQSALCLVSYICLPSVRWFQQSPQNCLKMREVINCCWAHAKNFYMQSVSSPCFKDYFKSCRHRHGIGFLFIILPLSICIIYVLVLVLKTRVWIVPWKNK